MKIWSELMLGFGDVEQLHWFLDASGIGVFGGSVQYVSKLIVNRVILSSLAKAVTGADVFRAS